MAIFDPDNPDHCLVWPKLVLVPEIDRLARIAGSASVRRSPRAWSESVSRLLRAVFQGPSVAEEFEALRGSQLYSTPIGNDELTWLVELQAELDGVKFAPLRKPYWSQRRGAQPQTLDFAGVVERYMSLVRRLDERSGLWAEAFGVDCPDGVGDPVDPAVRQIEDRLGRRLSEALHWPPSANADAWTADDLYDLIEVLHDLASWPGTWDSHDYGGCIGHPGNGSPTLGQAIYRHEVNQLLGRSDLGVRLADTGEDHGRIVVADSTALAEAIDDALESAPVGCADEVAHAVALFRQRGRDVVTMRSAIVALAGVLESHRSLLKSELLRTDEGALFHLANGFDLRHRRADQRTDFDPAFLEWIFHWYLATAALIGKLVSRQMEGPLEPVAVEPVVEEPF